MGYILHLYDTLKTVTFVVSECRRNYGERKRIIGIVYTDSSNVFSQTTAKVGVVMCGRTEYVRVAIDLEKDTLIRCCSFLFPCWFTEIL